MLAKAKVPRRSPHQTRHTYATRLIEHGQSLVYIKDQLGHSSIQITVDVYAHLIPGSHVGNVDILDTVTIKKEGTPEEI